VTIDDVIKAAEADGWQVREGETILSVGPRRLARFIRGEEIIDWIGGQIYRGKIGVPHSAGEIYATNSDAETLWVLLTDMKDLMDMTAGKEVKP